ncbi:nuclear GTPase SLIP-GC-like isoform X1 [Erpetoichthys calabaricus]|uniref:nuclear GTPase SLIP-GC-like isoform X1 n=1 Tax=Erpetoichthys calabaricus TaxID=27687 RepID=UPI002234AB2A|nr:nuclear GTPase SLIP-GC-like isoform X1 [Erpetoichthys calabaricus]
MTHQTTAKYNFVKAKILGGGTRAEGNSKAMETNDLKKMLENLISAQQEEAERQKLRDITHMKEFEKLTYLMETSLFKMNTQDDPETFLNKFEQFAQSYSWPKETWPQKLAPLLHGEAQLAYNALDDSGRQCYRKIKEAILQHYRATSDSYRQQFLSLKLLPGESPRFAALKLKDLAIQWLKPMETEKIQLLNKTVLKQFLNILPKEIQDQLQMSQPKDLETAITIAESSFSSFRNTKDISHKHSVLTGDVPMSPASLQNYDSVLFSGKKATCIGNTTPRPSEQAQVVSRFHSNDSLNSLPAEEVDAQSKLPLQRPGKKKLQEPHSLTTIKKRRLSENDETLNHCKKKHQEPHSLTTIKKRQLSENDETLNHYYNMEVKSRNILSHICNKLKESTCTGEEGNDFLKKLKEKVLKMSKNRDIQEEVFIGIFGMTGTGKSSLINALLNEFDLLPTSSLEACTSCIVQVQAHEYSNFTAEIEFLSKEEWEDELKELVGNCKHDRTQDSNVHNKGEDSESYNAKEIITAVYGSDGPNKSFPELVEKDIHGSLRSKFTAKSASELCKIMKSYIVSDSNEDSSCSYWPLVKVVKIFVPKKTCGLPDKVVLVDLPGSGDSNKERNNMWKEYITKCSYVWIVAEINRAQSNSNVLEILNTGLEGAAGGGRCQNIAIICTKTDNTGIKRNEMSKEASSKDERECIKKRNEKAKNTLIKKYNNQVKNFLMGSSDELDVDSKIKVFTVSSKEYWNIQRKMKSSLKIEDTELPLLQDYLKKIYKIQTIKAVKNYISEVSGIISFLNVPKEMAKDKANMNSSLYEKLKNSLTIEIKGLDKFVGDIQTTLQTQLQRGAREAVNKCRNNLESILNPKDANFSGYHKTIKALCKNRGSFRSSTGKFIDLNKKLASPIYAAVDNTFKNTFQFNRDTRRNIKGKLSLLQSNFEKDVALQSQSYRLIFIKTELRRVLVSMENEILRRKINIYNTIFKSIQKKLDQVYKDAYKMEGLNSMSSIQMMFRNKVREGQNSMFREAVEKMLDKFAKLKEFVITTIEDNMEISMKLALTQFPDGLNLPDSSKELEMMKKLCKKLNLNIFN